MGFRFRKSIKILPGIRLTLSKSGVSASIGKRGATINLSERGPRGTVGIPGTGMSYSKKLSTGEPASSAGSSWLLWVILALVLCAIFFGAGL